MKILDKYKKNPLDGFRDCVQMFETLHSNRFKDKVENATLEDPVYMEYVLKNILLFQHFLELTSEDIQAVCKNVTNYPEVLARAVYKSDLADQLDEYFPGGIAREIKDHLEQVKELKMSTQEDSKFNIIRTMRKLQSQNIIEPPRPWRLPPVSVIKLINHTDGLVTIDYENGDPALRGEMRHNKREGKWEHFYPTNKIMAEGEYVSDCKSGMWTFYYSNGELRAQGGYVQDVRDGNWTTWNRDGEGTGIRFERGKAAS